MRRKIVAIIAFTLLACCAFAVTEPWKEIEDKYSPDMDWFSAQSGYYAELPAGLNERETQIYREAYARGHYAALHPEFIEDMYVINLKTRKFHRTDCINTLLIDIENRCNSTDTKESLLAQGYSPCGACRPLEEH